VLSGTRSAARITAYKKTLVSSEARYWKRCRDFLKPGDLPLQFQTRIDKGCPYDCGLFAIIAARSAAISAI
jgi:hypothetical protein